MAHNLNTRNRLAKPVHIRLSDDRDEGALDRLAALDSREVPEGPFLLAEVDDELLVAAPLDNTSEPLADPFRPTADIVDLLKFRTRRLRPEVPVRRAA
jgi:hypothetical protein